MTRLRVVLEGEKSGGGGGGGVELLGSNTARSAAFPAVAHATDICKQFGTERHASILQQSVLD